MEDQILNYIKGHPTSSFAELMRIDGFKGCEGDSYVFEFKSYPNIILWANISGEAVAALNTLLDKKKIEMLPTTSFIYLVDGTSLDLPIAKSFKKYKSPRWLPVVFSEKQ